MLPRSKPLKYGQNIYYHKPPQLTPHLSASPSGGFFIFLIPPISTAENHTAVFKRLQTDN